MQRNATCLALAGLLTMGLSPINEATAGENAAPLFEVSGDSRASREATHTDSDGYLSTRLRVQAQVNPVENTSLTGRVHLSNFYDREYFTGEGEDDNDLWIDRLFLNWDKIASTPFSLQAGRLPTTEGGPAYLRLGLDKPQGSLSPFTDIALDGVMLGYKYVQPWPGSIQFYYGTQFEAGYEDSGNEVSAYMNNDTSVYGLNWAVLQQGPRSLSLQSFLFKDIYNLREDMQTSIWWAPTLHKTDLGDLYHTAITYQEQWQKLNGFVSLGWSHTDPSAQDEFGVGLLSSFWEPLEEKDGYALYAGVRYDLADLYSKVGLEYNYGSKNWINLSQNFDTQKLGTRGSVLEGYWIFSPPLPQAVAGTVKDFRIRLGYQYYWYDYAYSGMWLATPIDMDVLKSDPLNALFYDPPEHDYKLYGSIDFRF